MAYARLGILLSKDTPQPNYAALHKACVSFVVICLDKRFGQHVSACASAGLYIGTYIPATAQTLLQATQEAREAAALLSDYALDYPLFYFMEKKVLSTKNKELNTQKFIAFADEAAEYGLFPALRVNVKLFERYFDISKIEDIYDVWLDDDSTGSPYMSSKHDYGQVMRSWGVYDIKGSRLQGIVCHIDYPSKISATNQNILY
ncbi:hypothetical protein FACS1894105_09800 [Clostridia bacterium]|nr:hypothetical protein FACS1894105_09800 [Clostridia bacterium]